MSQADSYWTNKLISRRAALRNAALAGSGLAAMSLVGCGGGSTGDSKPKPSGDTAAVDLTKGKPGGNLIVNNSSYPANFSIVNVLNNAKIAGLVHSSLLQFKSGKAGVEGASLDIEPDLAVAMPEQPDQNTFVFKIRQGVKFHNGRPLTSEDVKYSIDRYATWDRSVYRDTFPWIDRTEAPDAQTFIVKAKAPFADALASLAVYNAPFILAKEHEESPDSAQKLMGSGPYVWGDSQPPVSVTLKKNPDYYDKPFPYFDQVTFLAVVDTAKQVADFASRQVHVTVYGAQDMRDQVKQSRPDAVMREWPGAGHAVIYRADQAPWSDKRVRQALSMTIDRKQIRDGVTKGEGEDDQLLSVINTSWGFRKPKDLKSAKNWVFDPAEARKLLTAAGIDKTIEKTMPHQNAQQVTDMATLAAAKWRELGIANLKLSSLAGNLYQTTVNIGAFDDLALATNQQAPVLGLFLRNRYWSAPEGVKSPTPNVGHVNDPDLNRLLEKQITQFNREERRSTFRDIEELYGEQQYRTILSTYSQSWFWDPSLRGIDVPLYAYIGAWPFPRYWWFDK